MGGAPPKERPRRQGPWQALGVFKIEHQICGAAGGGESQIQSPGKRDPGPSSAGQDTDRRGKQAAAAIATAYRRSALSLSGLQKGLPQLSVAKPALIWAVQGHHPARSETQNQAGQHKPLSKHTCRGLKNCPSELLPFGVRRGHRTSFSQLGPMSLVSQVTILHKDPR